MATKNCQGWPAEDILWLYLSETPNSSVGINYIPRTDSWYVALQSVNDDTESDNYGNTYDIAASIKDSRADAIRDALKQVGYIE